jgi:hypothetical protein
VPIEFIGVWDTVDAVGMPFALAGIVNYRFVYQFKVSDLRARSGGEAGLSRASRSTTLGWPSNRCCGPAPTNGLSRSGSRGAHSNVGGGYPKQGMSLVALDWMLAHAEVAGLRLNGWTASCSARIAR